jgi:hypothetical protein
LLLIRGRIGRHWDDEVAPRLRATLRQAWADGLDPTSALSRDLVGLGGILVREREYVRAAGVGANAATTDTGNEPFDATTLGRDHADRVRPYADRVGERIAGELAAALLAIRGVNHDNASASEAIADAVAGRRWSAVRYAGPQWAAGMAAYAHAYDQANPGTRYLWTLDPASQHCASCPELADESEDAGGWLLSEVPCWPGDGFGTECLDRCRCSIVVMSN